MILNASDATHKMDLAEYMQTLKVGGDFHMVGLGDEPLPSLAAMHFTTNGARITGSHLGNHQEMEEMLQLAADKGIRPVVQTIDISEEGCKEAVERVQNGKVHFRLTLTGFDKAFKA
jgi:alcohol dehydrogenase (NADP+)